MSAWTANEQPVAAGEAVFTEIKNVCIWNETNGGMNTF
jgi:DNA methylase